jgi:paraquat-inducible protein B
MTDQPTQPGAEISTANVKQKSKAFSVVWVIPLVAALVGGWMVFQNLLHEKAKIEVTFKDAGGIEAGKTLVKLRDINIGKVTDVSFTENLGVVRVAIEFDNIPPERVTDKTRFWVVKPRVGAGGVSGLGTLLSGAFIEADPGEGGKPATQFVGLEEPGVYQLGNPGTSYRLQAATLGSLSRGAPVKYRDVAVGQVTRYELKEDGDKVGIEIFIRAPFDKLVNKDTRFWNISGLKFDVGAEGVKLKMESVATLIAGGIAFSANDSASGAQAKADSVFTLYETESEKTVAEEVAFSVPMKLYFEKGVKGLAKGAPVTYKGLRLGTVDQVAVEANIDTSELITFATIRIEPDRLLIDDPTQDQSNEKRTQDVHRFFEILVAQNVRAQLQTGSLLTGKALVVFDHFPQAEPATVKYADGIPILPTIPEESFAHIMAKVDAILAKIDAIPIKKIGSDLAVMSGNLADTSAKIDALPIEDIGRDLAGTADKLDAIPVGEISSDLKELLESLNGLVDSLNAAQGGVLGVQTRDALAEIGRAARALRGMAEYLERHPEALLKGKK